MNVPTKICTKCDTTYPATTEHFHRHVGGLHPRCKKCRSEERKEHYQRNYDRERTQQREYSHNHSKEAVDRVRRWRKKHPDSRRKFRQRHLDRLRATGREYYQANKEACIQNARNARARVRNAEGQHTLKDIRELYARQNGKCAYCGTSLADNFHVDHVIPLTRNGSNSPENLALACPTCNLSKGNKLLSEWQRL